MVPRRRATDVHAPVMAIATVNRCEHRALRYSSRKKSSYSMMCRRPVFTARTTSSDRLHVVYAGALHTRLFVRQSSWHVEMLSACEVMKSKWRCVTFVADISSFYSEELRVVHACIIFLCFYHFANGMSVLLLAHATSFERSMMTCTSFERSETTNKFL